MMMADVANTASKSTPSPEVDSIKQGSLNEPAFQISPTTPSKRKREDDLGTSHGQHVDGRNVRKGTAPIKREFLVNPGDNDVQPRDARDAADDDNAEAFHHKDRQTGSQNSKPSSKRREKNKGQNKARQFGSSRDEVGLCSTRVTAPEFSPDICQFGDRCKFEHDLRKYLSQHKREDLKTFDGVCPVWALRGRCHVGWKCRFVGSHSTERKLEDGRQELVLVENEDLVAKHPTTSDSTEADVANVISIQDRINLTKKKFPTPKSEIYIKWLDSEYDNRNERSSKPKTEHSDIQRNGIDSTMNSAETKGDNTATYHEIPLLPSEKRRLYFGAETPVLAPLTTQGNLPFRRLCSSLGATFTYSEMAMSLPLLQGHKPEWALIKAHESEIQPPTFSLGKNIVYDYDQSKDMRFGAQIAGNKPWVCVKATEVLTALLPKGLRCVDFNVGCPIDLVYREGAGSALMDSPAKLEKILRGMNLVSNDIPITCKIRMGTKDKAPTALKLVDRLVLGNKDGSAPSGVAAITLHGRSRQQRYTRQADWEYISETATLIQELNTKADDISDTIREADDRDLPNGQGGRRSKVYFLGNGDVYSYQHYDEHIKSAGVDSVMVARGALIKPWIFDEIQSGQDLDPSSSQRLEYIKTFCKNGLEAWGSDEIGVGQTRRFLLEWLSFACR
jgi:tRNA-dihydrouridine synthase 3